VTARRRAFAQALLDGVVEVADQQAGHGGNIARQRSDINDIVGRDGEAQARELTYSGAISNQMNSFG
jgi:hypothetical protein